MEQKKEIANRLDQFLKEKGLTNVELSEKWNIHPNVISKYRNGHTSIISIVDKVRELGGDLNYILTGDTGEYERNKLLEDSEVEEIQFSSSKDSISKFLTEIYQNSKLSSREIQFDKVFFGLGAYYLCFGNKNINNLIFDEDYLDGEFIFEIDDKFYSLGIRKNDKSYSIFRSSDWSGFDISYIKNKIKRIYEPVAIIYRLEPIEW